MGNIDLPAEKEMLWFRMRADLISFFPNFSDTDVLLCPACLRPLPFDEFSVEHIIPKQALALDPLDARQSVTQNQRSGLTLLCRKPLVVNKKRVNGHGCNSWKGRFYDKNIRDVIQGKNLNNINTSHQVALFVVGYLALFRKFGYQISLSRAGLIMRAQFFNPNNFIKGVPDSSQMILTGGRLSYYNEINRSYWSEPFRISVDGLSAFIVLRNMCFRMPLSRDPAVPIARFIPYTPQKFKFRPDLTTVFE